MNNTDTKTVKIVPKQPRFISDILKRPARIGEEITMALNEREIVRCMQYADVYDGDTPITPSDISGNTLVKDEETEDGKAPGQSADDTTTEEVNTSTNAEQVSEPTDTEQVDDAEPTE